jgi:hypothetical protein
VDAKKMIAFQEQMKRGAVVEVREVRRPDTVENAVEPKRCVSCGRLVVGVADTCNLCRMD